MRGLRLFVLAGSFLLASLCAPAVEASGGGEAIGGGTITFVGAIVAPTCSMPLESETYTGGLPAQSSRETCAGQGGPSANAARVYQVSVQHLSSAEPDRVLQYFGSYVRASGEPAADPVLLIQTYE